MNKLQHKTLPQEGYVIHYFVSGTQNKETIVFLHPAFSDHTCFYKQVEFFAQNFQVITIDLLGHGLSRPEKGKDKIDKSAEHINEILQKENVEKAHIVGVSMGSLIAQYFALQYPKQTSSLTVLGGYNINHDNKEVNRTQRKEMFRWLFKVIFSMDAFRKYTGSVSALNQEEQVRFYESAKGFTRKSFPAMSGLGNIIKERKFVPRSYPLLILTGEKDIEIAKKAACEWHKEEPDSHFFSIENAGHCANMDNAEQFNTIVSEFIILPLATASVLML